MACQLSLPSHRYRFHGTSTFIEKPTIAINRSDSHHNYVYERQQAFLKVYDLARTALNSNQKRRNAIYNRKVHSPLYNEGQKVPLHNPVVLPGKSPKTFSPWRGPYNILKRIDDITFKIQELKTMKGLVVHYDRLKLFREPPPTSNVPTRNVSHLNTPFLGAESPPTQNPPTIDHDQGCEHYTASLHHPAASYPSSGGPSSGVASTPTLPFSAPSSSSPLTPSSTRPVPSNNGTPMGPLHRCSLTPPSGPRPMESPEESQCPPRSHITIPGPITSLVP